MPARHAGLAGALILGALLVGRPAPMAAQDGVGFRFAFGHQEMHGDLGTVLEGAVDAEFSVLVPVSVLRVGGGANWASFEMADSAASWSQVRFHVLVGLPVRMTSWLRPYTEARYVFRRLRPEDDRYFGADTEELLRDFSVSGSGFEMVAGTELTLTRRLAIDVSGAVSLFSVSPDLSEDGLASVDSGQTVRIHLGAAWFPVSGS